jgi:hypothetical protein
MDHTWPVEIVDDVGGAVTGAKVALVEKSALGTEIFPYPGIAATHDDKGGGKYEPKAPITPSAGKWLLIVSLKGKSTVVQPLTITDKKTLGFAAAATSGEVMTVVTTTTLRTVGESKVRETAFRVTLHPAAELVFIGGIDYHKKDPSTGWLFHLYGLYRAEVLVREKKFPNPGAIVTVFSPAKITRITRVRGRSGWVDVEVHQIHDPSTRVIPTGKGEHYTPSVGTDIHIQDFYKHISEVGAREPGSVKEAGLFSHSYPGGPILYNTGQSSFHASRASRDPNDFDARAKDWNSTNMALYPDLKKAFAKDGRFVIWGCSATTLYRNRSIAAMKAIKEKKGENERLLVRASYTNHDTHEVEATDEERITELEHRWWMDALFRNNIYAAEAAKALGIETRAACPGVGSDPQKVEGLEMLFVNVPSHALVYEYFRTKFGPEFAETKGKWDAGYCDYHALQTRTAVPRPTFDPAYYRYHVQKAKTRWANPGATLTFWNEESVDHPTGDATLVIKPTEMLTPAKKGVLYVLKDKNPAASKAVFVTVEGKIHDIVQDDKKEWTVDFGER